MYQDNSSTGNTVDRRRLMTSMGAVAGAAALGGTGLFSAGTRPAFAASAGSVQAEETGDAFDAVRAAWRLSLTGGTYDTADPHLAAAVTRTHNKAQNHLDKIDRSASRTRVFSDLAMLPENANDANAAADRLRVTYERLRDISLAYSFAGSRFEGDPAVRADILAGLELAHVLAYNTDQEGYGTWFPWRVGIPRALNISCLLHHDELAPDTLTAYVDTIRHWVPNAGTNTGTNLIWACDIIMRSGILARDEERVRLGKDSLAPAFVYSPLYFTDPVTYSGFYRDGSFLQHAVTPYNGGYGQSFLAAFAEALEVLVGSPWEFSADEAAFVLEQVERGFLPLIYNGEMMDCVRGRYISRSNWRAHHTAYASLGSILQLAPVAGPETGARWRAICKGWVQRDTYASILDLGPLTRVARVKELLNDDTVRPAAEPVSHKLYGSMDRAVHRRPGWAYAISMNSKRVVYFEHMGVANLKGFHTGSGMTYLYNGDASQYDDEFWPTVDAYRLPGTTVDTQQLTLGGQYLPLNADWAGGAMVDGEFAAVAFDSEGVDSSLRAKKSWFCLDDFVLALGAGITGGSGQPVETIVENRNLHAEGTNALRVDGRAQPAEQGWTGEFRHVSWAHIDGVAGYVFPGGVRLHALREERTGAWTDIETNPIHGGTADPITRRYLTLWLDHGASPEDASYAYLLAPGASPLRTAWLALTLGGAKILANTDTLQAVRVPRLGLTMANFYAAGEIDGITTEHPCSVVLRERAGKLTVAVADPGQRQETVSLRLDRRGYRSWEVDDTVTVGDLARGITLTADTRDAQGRSHSAVFRRRH